MGGKWPSTSAASSFASIIFRASSSRKDSVADDHNTPLPTPVPLPTPMKSEQPNPKSNNACKSAVGAVKKEEHPGNTNTAKYVLTGHGVENNDATLENKPNKSNKSLFNKVEKLKWKN